MKHKSLLLTFAVAGIASGGYAFQNSDSLRDTDDDTYKAIVFHSLTQGPTADAGPCNRQAWAGLKAGRRDANADFLEEISKAVNIGDPDDQWEAVLDAFDELDEGLELAMDQFWARLDLCETLGGDIYEPEIDPEDFVDGIDHPFFPKVPGTTLVYELTGGEEYERIEVTTTDETREIMGVECMVVRDTEWVGDEPDGELEIVEDTLDYFAQDEDGNVWYFGELSFELEDGEIVEMSGSWIAGEDGAHPGIIVFADPQVGTTYRQEFLLFEAEDVGQILSLNETVQVPFGEFTGCLHTRDFTPLEPDEEEQKFYAAGVGPVLELDPETGERLELVDIITGS